MILGFDCTKGGFLTNQLDLPGSEYHMYQSLKGTNEYLEVRPDVW